LEEIKYTQGFLAAVQGKLSNERFVAGAPEQVVAVERQKEADALQKLVLLESRLIALK
jgi:valyl-tRNA synthetase